MIQRPLAIGLLLCEQVIVEQGTQNITPVNCFSRRAAKSFPTEPLRFAVCAVLTDGMGKMDLELVVEELVTLEAVYRRVVACEFNSPHQEARAIFRVRCPFPKPGKYQVLLLAEGELIAQRTLILNEGDHP